LKTEVLQGTVGSNPTSSDQKFKPLDLSRGFFILLPNFLQT